MARRHTRKAIQAKHATKAAVRKTKSPSHRAKRPADVHVHGGTGHQRTVNAPTAW